MSEPTYAVFMEEGEEPGNTALPLETAVAEAKRYAKRWGKRVTVYKLVATHTFAGKP